MSKFITFFLFFIAGIGTLYAIYSSAQKVSKNIDSQKIINKIVNSSEIIPQKSSERYIFIPYWTFEKNIVIDSDYSLIYFGLGVNSKGIELSDKGFEKLKTFATLVPNAKEKVLAIRMVDSAINAQVLKEQNLEEKIANDSIKYAKENGFDTILLDFETSAFAFDSNISNISDFYTIFSKTTHDNGFKFYVTLFGDSYYRARAYDVKKIGKLADKVFVMTYDFHKSNGNPGPIFPLNDDKKYGYDLEKMVIDFQKDVDNKKIVIVLGFFGYDWRVDKDQKTQSSGVSLSTNQITKEFIEKCEYKNCSLTRSTDSKEPSIIYLDDSGRSHIVWFEDQISIDKKIEFLKSKGIQEIGYWAYSYF